MALTERWTAPKLPGPTGEALNGSLARLERVLGRTPVTYPDTLVSAAYTAVDTDEVLLVDTTGGGVTVTLPTANAGLRGRRFNIKKMDAGANSVTVSATGAEFPLSWNTQYMSYTVQCVLSAAPATYTYVII